MNTQSNAMPESFESQRIAPAVASATRPLYWSMRRELWENRSIYLAPLAVAALFLFGFLISTIHLPAKMRAASALDPMQQQAMLEQPYDFAALLLMGTASDRCHLLLSRRAARRTSRSQHPVLEVAAGFRSHDRAVEGQHSARRSAAVHLRDHHCHAVDHAAARAPRYCWGAGGASRRSGRTLPLFQMSVMLLYHLLAMHAL